MGSASQVEAGCGSMESGGCWNGKHHYADFADGNQVLAGISQFV